AMGRMVDLYPVNGTLYPAGRSVLPAPHGRVRAGDIVHREATAAGHLTDDHAIVEHATLVFRSLQTQALPVAASRDLIARVDDQLWKASARTGARALTAIPTEGNA